MSSIVLELQRDALDRNVAASDLLRKALAVATKLSVKDFRSWIESELNGYNGEVPAYRTVPCQLQAWNPSRGWQPVLFEDARMAEILSQRGCNQAIGEIEDLVARNRGGTFLMPLPPEDEERLVPLMSMRMTVMQMTPTSTLVQVLDAVRTTILNWALKLEQDGILGENLSFGAEEVGAASQRHYNVNNFYGSVDRTQIQTGTAQSSQAASFHELDLNDVRTFIGEIAAGVERLGLGGSEKKELQAELQTIRSQVESPRPKQKIIRESLGSLRRILEGAAGEVLAQGLLLKVAQLLGS